MKEIEMDDLDMIEISVKSKSGNGTNSLASYIATLLHHGGFDVVVNSSDEINAGQLSEEKLQHIKDNIMVAISVEQI
jgi:hypothetical protein